jgi:excisionase family DNA binding protein
MINHSFSTDNGGDKVTHVIFEPVPRPFLTATEVCEALRISRPTLSRWMKDGMPAHQVNPNRGRLFFDLAEVNDWIKSRCSSPTPGQEAVS